MKQILLIVILFSTISFSSFGAEKYFYTVSLDGTGDFSSVQAAVDACKCFPDQRIVIFVKDGTYHEKVKVASMNNRLTIKGESVENTRIVYEDFFDKIQRGRNSTFYTYTLMVAANDFCLENITIENAAGPVGQAVALHVEGDRCVFRNCRILGNQDTVYAAGETSRQYFYNCYVEGTTDFVFGESTAVFESCTICSKADSYITAASTTKGKEFGFVFLNCSIAAANDVRNAYLGRPWRDFARVAFIRCELGQHIAPEGWSNWDDTQRDKTVFFAEYRNTGSGASTLKRVKWTKQLKPGEARKYTLKNILRGYDNWQPQK